MTFFHVHQELLGPVHVTLIMTNSLAMVLAAPLLASTVSRLLVDLNDSTHNNHSGRALRLRREAIGAPP